MQPAPKAHEQQPPKASAPPLSRRELREHLTLTVRWRGGPEAWWEIKARGRTWRYPGHECLHDVLTDIYRQG